MNISRLFIWLGFFNGFISPLGFLSYLNIYKMIFYRYTVGEIIFLVTVILYLVFNLFFNIIDSGSIFFSLNAVRFFFGFMVFFFIFKNEDFNFEYIFKYLVILVIGEAVLVNTIIDAFNLPNYPPYYAGGECKISNVTGECIISGHFATDGFPYQRPYSFAAMANVTAPIMIAIFALQNTSNKFSTLIITFVTLVIMSGTGFIALAIYLILKKEYLFIFLGIVFIVLANVLPSYSIIFELINSRIGVEYVWELIKVKFYQFGSFYLDAEGYADFLGLASEKDDTGIVGINAIFTQFELHNYLFGGLNILNGQGGFGGDFGWLWLFICFGLLSFLILIPLIISNINKYNFIPVLILLISTFHYPVIFYLSGQIVFAYALTRNEKNI